EPRSRDLVPRDAGLRPLAPVRRRQSLGRRCARAQPRPFLRRRRTDDRDRAAGEPDAAARRGAGARRAAGRRSMSDGSFADLDGAALERWLGEAVPGHGAVRSIEKFPGGQSNPTYRVETDRGPLVLRRKPFGKLLPSAHAVEREHRLISALHPAGVPVAAPVALCEDPEVIGAPFYLMELVEGRTLWNGALPDCAPDERGAIYRAMIDTLAKLHAVNPVAVGLGDYGAPGNYFARQVGRWTKQYRMAQTDDIPEVERLIEWLPATLPQQDRT